MDISIQTLFDAWRIAEFATWAPGTPATEEEIQEVEEKIGTPLPPLLRDVYRLFNGWETGNLNFNSLNASQSFGEPYGLMNANEKLTELGWVIPNEIRLFAGDGCGDLFGIWLPTCRNPIFDHPVIAVGGSSGDCLGIAGTNLLSFLLGWNSYYIVLKEWNAVEGEGEEKLKKIQTALDMLQVPKSLRGKHFDQEMNSFVAWADPTLPNPDNCPYDQRYSVADLKQIFDGQA